MVRLSKSMVRPMAALPSNDLAMLLVVLIWGANFSVVKVALDYIPPLAFTALRFSIAAVVLSVLLWRREGSLAAPAGGWPRLIALGVIGNTLYQALFIISISHTTAANSALLLASAPVFTVVFGALFGIERLSRVVVGGVALALIGVLLVVIQGGVDFSSQTFVGNILALVSAVCWTMYTLGVRWVGGDYSALRITTLTMLTGLPGMLLLGAPEFAQVNWAAIGITGWIGVAYASLMALVLGYVLWNASVQAVGSNRTAIYNCVVPLVATLVAWPVFNQPPGALQGVGALLIIGGVLLSRRVKKDEG